MLCFRTWKVISTSFSFQFWNLEVMNLFWKRYHLINDKKWSLDYHYEALKLLNLFPSTILWFTNLCLAFFQLINVLRTFLLCISVWLMKPPQILMVSIGWWDIFFNKWSFSFKHFTSFITGDFKSRYKDHRNFWSIGIEEQ